jgi:DNA-binding CsgD family transcriptional regulator
VTDSHTRRSNQLNPTRPLSDRERECLGWVAKGKTSWETAAILQLSERTVNFHVLNACRKLNVYGRQAGVTQALNQGLLTEATLTAATA